MIFILLTLLWITVCCSKLPAFLVNIFQIAYFTKCIFDILNSTWHFTFSGEICLISSNSHTFSFQPQLHYKLLATVFYRYIMEIYSIPVNCPNSAFLVSLANKIHLFLRWPVSIIILRLWWCFQALPCKKPDVNIIFWTESMNKWPNLSKNCCPWDQCWNVIAFFDQEIQ